MVVTPFLQKLSYVHCVQRSRLVWYVIETKPINRRRTAKQIHSFLLIVAMSLIYTSQTSRHNVSGIVPFFHSFRYFVSFVIRTLTQTTSCWLYSRATMSPAVPRRKGRREVAPHSSAKECSKVINILTQPPQFFSLCAWLKYLIHIFIIGWSCRILNVTPAKEQGITAGIPNYFENASTSKIRYKRIPVYDASTSNLLSYADEMVEFISNGLHHGGVLVHCQKGVSRSATAVVMFLMR
jgi:hypothetical protein